MNYLKRLYRYCHNEQNAIRLASLFSILNKIFDLAPPVLIGLAVDAVVKPESSPFFSWGIESTIKQVQLIAVLSFIIWALESWFEYLFSVYWRNLAQRIQHKLRVDCYRHLQNLDLKYFSDKSSGSLISILNDDVNQLERFLDGGANSLIQVATTVVVVGAIFFYMSPEIAIFSFVPVPIIIFGSFYYQKKIEPRYQNVRAQAGGLSSLLSNNISGIATIKAYVAEGFEQKRLERQSMVYSQANSRAISLSSSFSPLIRMAVLVGFLFTLVLGAYKVESGALIVGSYSVLVYMTQRLLWPLTRLGETFDLFQRAMASTQRIFSVLETPIDIKEGDQELLEVQGKLEFRNLKFSYDKNHPVIHDLNIKVQPGETIGLVGQSGSGKSTLLKLLLRYYDPEKGMISIDDKSIESLTLKSLRQCFSYVGQDSYLFHGTIEENIRYGSFDKSQEELYQAAKEAEIHQFIMSLPLGYQTIVGERGLKLSGGQRQRVSIARAILKDAPIFLFDEATSAVDNETEASIQRSLDVITKSKTTIIIAHRLSTVVNADRIYVLENGHIVQSGTHQELSGLSGVYHNLWSVQTGLLKV